MAKLTRLTGKVFGQTADATGQDPEIGQFGSAKAGTYVGTGDVATIQSLPAWSNGWIDAVTPSQQFPTLPEMTGVHKVLSYQNAYILQQGVPEWDSATTYYENGFCSYNGSIYVSLIDNNTNIQPDSNTSVWSVYGTGDYANKDLSNLTTKGHTKLQYAPFAINTGSVGGSTAVQTQFVRPNLSSNGTMGGNDFAVNASSYYEGGGETSLFAWKAVNGTNTGEGDCWGAGATDSTPDYMFYYPIALNVTNIQIVNRNTPYSQNVLAILSGTVYGSNDNSTWTQLKTFSNSTTTANTSWNIDLSDNTNSYNYYKISCGNRCCIGQLNITATYLDTFAGGNNNTLSINGATQYYKRNITEVGTLTSNKSVISGFGLSNYATFPQAIPTSTATSWEIVFAFQNGSGEFIRSIGTTTSYSQGIDFLINGNSRLEANLFTSSGGRIASVTGSTTIGTGQYWAKLEFTGSAYNIYLSVDGSNFTLEDSDSASTKVPDYNGSIGVNHQFNANVFSGSIDLSQSYININGSTWWNGIISGTSSDYDYSELSGSTFNCAPCTITTCDGRTSTFTNTSSYDVSNTADGDYTIFKNITTGALSLGSDILFSKSLENNSTYWMDISKIPANLKVYNNGSYVVTNDLVYIGNCTIASNLVTSISNRLFNDSGYIVDRSYIGIDMPSDKTITLTLGASGSTYTAPAAGWFCLKLLAQSSTLSHAELFVGDRNSTKLISQGNDYYANLLAALLPVKKGDIVTADYTGCNTTDATITLGLFFTYAQGAELEA